MDQWASEISRASGWWTDRMKEAIELAFPTNGMWKNVGIRLVASNHMNEFRSVLADEIDKDFVRRKVEWNPVFPGVGAAGRKVGLEGHFLSPPLRISIAMVGWDEAIPFIPDGCCTVINPGSAMMVLSRKHKPETHAVVSCDPTLVFDQRGLS